MFREEVTSALVGFHVGSPSWSNWTLEMVVFVKRRKSENPENNPQIKARANTNKTQIWLRAGIKPGPH